MISSTDRREIYANQPIRSLSLRIYLFGLVFVAPFSAFPTVQCWISATPLTFSLYVGLTPPPLNFHVTAAMAVDRPATSLHNSPPSYVKHYGGAFNYRVTGDEIRRNGNDNIEKKRYSPLSGDNSTKRGQQKAKPNVDGRRRIIYSVAAPLTTGTSPGDVFNNINWRTTAPFSTITSTTSKIIVTSATLPVNKFNKQSPSPSSSSPTPDPDNVIFPTPNQKKKNWPMSPSSSTARAILASSSPPPPIYLFGNAQNGQRPSPSPTTTITWNSNVKSGLVGDNGETNKFINEPNANKNSDTKNTTSSTATTTISDNVRGVATTTNSTDVPIFREIISATPASCPPTQKLDTEGKCREVY